MSKKQIVVVLVLLSITAFSCSKVKKLENDITFKKFIPFLTLNPIDSISKLYNTSCSEFIPYPFDSVESVEIDIDKNGENDFRFTYSTSYNFVSSSDSCRNHNSRIVLKALGVGNSILVDDKTTERIHVFGVNDEINNEYQLSSNAFIYLDDDAYSEEIAIESGNKYLGVKMFSGSLGWIKVFHKIDTFSFSIMEHALNRTMQLNINAGQKQ